MFLLRIISCILDWDSFDLSGNKDYPVVKDFLGPSGEAGNALWHEAGFYATTVEIIHENYMELYYPTETQWREKAVEDFKVAAQGVLNNKLK